MAGVLTSLRPPPAAKGNGQGDSGITSPRCGIAGFSRGTTTGDNCRTVGNRRLQATTLAKSLLCKGRTAASPRAPGTNRETVRVFLCGRFIGAPGARKRYGSVWGIRPRPRRTSWAAGLGEQKANLTVLWAKCHTFATCPQAPDFGAAPKSRTTNNQKVRSPVAARSPVASPVSPVPKGSLSDGGRSPAPLRWL